MTFNVRIITDFSVANARTLLTESLST